MMLNLYYGRSKKKMDLIMTDKESAINFYLQSRACKKQKVGRMGNGWFKVEPAEPGAEKFRKKSATIGGNSCNCPPTIGKDGKTKYHGWVGKNGFSQHT